MLQQSRLHVVYSMKKCPRCSADLTLSIRSSVICQHCDAKLERKISFLNRSIAVALFFPVIYFLMEKDAFLTLLFFAISNAWLISSIEYSCGSCQNKGG